MGLWVLSAAAALGFQGGMEFLAQGSPNIREVLGWIIVGVAGAVLTRDFGYGLLRIWWALAGGLLVWHAAKRMAQASTHGYWGRVLESTLAVLALWWVSADALAVAVGYVCGVGLAVALDPWKSALAPSLAQWEILSLGAVGLQDLTQAIIGSGGVHAFNPLWMVPWLVIGEIRVVVFSSARL
jgi:hypothetical protein